MFEYRGKVDEPDIRDKNIKVWKHFLGLMKFANFRANCPAAGPRYGYKSQVILDIFDSASAGNQVDAQSIAVVIDGSLIDIDAQFKEEVLNVVKPGGFGLEGV